MSNLGSEVFRIAEASSIKAPFARLRKTFGTISKAFYDMYTGRDLQNQLPVVYQKQENKSGTMPKRTEKNFIVIPFKGNQEIHLGVLDIQSGSYTFKLLVVGGKLHNAQGKLIEFPYMYIKNSPLAESFSGFTMIDSSSRLTLLQSNEIHHFQQILSLLDPKKDINLQAIDQNNPAVKKVIQLLTNSSS